MFQELADIHANARRGEITMIVGQPSAGKSVVALWHAVQWTMDHGLRGIYWSADTTAFVAAARTCSMITGRPYPKAEDALREREPSAMGALAEVTHQGMEWVFDAWIDSESLTLNMDAFLEKWGGYPDYVILDNLTDVDTGQDGDEFSALRGMVRDLNFLIRKSNAAGLILHHTSESEKDDPLPPRKAIHGKVSQKPTVILGTSKGEGKIKPIGPLKNRYGMDNRLGKMAFSYLFDAEALQFNGSIGRVLE